MEFTNSEIKVLTEAFYRFQATENGQEALFSSMQVPGRQVKALTEKVTNLMCGQEVVEKAPSKEWQKRLDKTFADLNYVLDNMCEDDSINALNIAIGILRHIDWEIFIQVYSEVKR